MYLFKKKIIFNFMIFLAIKKGRKTNLSPSFVAVFASEIRDGYNQDPGSR
jgi:hypothetical protein